ncbi:hypothetical protein JCM3770_004494 [Rhodotorula araucariae]
MARTRAASPTVRALPQRERRPSTRYSPAEYAAAPSAAQTRRTPAKATYSKTKTVKRRAGLADDRASTATGGNTTLRAKVLAAVLRLSRERKRGRKGIGHSSIRSYLLQHGENPDAKGATARIKKTKEYLIDQGVLVQGASPGSTIAVRAGVDKQVKGLCDVQVPDSSDDERACNAYLSSKLAAKAPTTSRSRSRSRSGSRRVPDKAKSTRSSTSTKRRTQADADDASSASDGMDYHDDAPRRHSHVGKGKGKQPSPAHHRARPRKKVRVVEPEDGEEGSDASHNVDQTEDDKPARTRTRSKGRKVVKPGAVGKSKGGTHGGTSRLTKAQLVVELDALRQKESERADEFEDLREKLTEMSEVNQTWEARARILGYHDDGEVVVSGMDEENEEQHAPEQDVHGEQQIAQAGEGDQQPYTAPAAIEPSQERDQDADDFDGMGQPFLADDVDLDAELDRAGWPQPPPLPPHTAWQGENMPSATPFAASGSSPRPFAGAPLPGTNGSHMRGSSVLPSGSSPAIVGGVTALRRLYLERPAVSTSDRPYTTTARVPEDAAGFDDEYPRLSSDNEDGQAGAADASPEKGKGRVNGDTSTRTENPPLNPGASNVASSSSPAKSEAGHFARFGGYGARGGTPSQPSSPMGASLVPEVRHNPYGRVAELERERAEALVRMDELESALAQERKKQEALKEDLDGILHRHHEAIDELTSQTLELKRAVEALQRKRVADAAASAACMRSASEIERELTKVRMKGLMLEEDMEVILHRHHETIAELASQKLKLEGTVVALRHKRAAADAASTARLQPARKLDAPVSVSSQAVQTPPLLDPTAQIAASAIRIAELENALARTTTRAADLDEKLEETAAAYHALLESDRARQEQAKLDMHKIATVEAALAQERGAWVAERAAWAREKDVSKAQVEERLDEVQKARDKLIFNLSAVRDALAAAEADRDVQARASDVADEEKRAAQAERDRLAAEIAKLQNEHELAKLEIRRRNEELAKTDAQVQQLKASAFSRALEHTQPDQRAVTAYTHDVADLQDRIEELEELKHDADGKAQAEADAEEMREELSQLRSRLNDVERALTEAERGRTAAECKVLELERGVETASANATSLALEQAALAAQLAEAVAKLESITAEKVAVEARIGDHAVTAGFLADPASVHSLSHVELGELIESLMLALHSRNDVVEHLGEERDQQADLLKSLLHHANELRAACAMHEDGSSSGQPAEPQAGIAAAFKLIGDKFASLQVQLESATVWRTDAQARALVIASATQELVDLEAALAAALEANASDSSTPEDLLSQIKHVADVALETTSLLKEAHQAIEIEKAKVAAEQAKAAASESELAKAVEELNSKESAVAVAQASLRASAVENERLRSRLDECRIRITALASFITAEDHARAPGMGGSSMVETAAGPAADVSAVAS